ncbi:MAG: ABC transporter permease [Eubacterium sp.]|nr:ABC transporter permease [Eubacterium sp.]
MFLHNLKYELLTSLRARDLFIWLMIFPVILGTFFKIAFGSLYEKDTVFNTIPTAIVEEEKNDTFRDVVKSIEEADEPLLSATWTDRDTAMKMLKEGDVKGVIFVSSESTDEQGDESFSSFAGAFGFPTATTKLSLSVASNSTESTILKKFIENYMVRERAIFDAAKNNPADVQGVVDALSKESAITTEMPLTDGNHDPFTTYFYNLIAMVALFGSITGLHIAVANQANLSPLGARRCCTPTPKFKTMLAGLTGSYIAQALCVVICITFEVLVLGVDYGDRLLFVYLAGVLGGMVGVSMGFFIGSIGSLSLNAKVGISMAVTMPCCFLSGLMMGDIKYILEQNAPIINDLNPVAIVCDSIYYLTVDADMSRYWMKLLSMGGLIVVFVALGVMVTRRKQYASI